MNDQEMKMSASMSADGFGTATSQINSLTNAIKNLQSAMIKILGTTDELGQKLAGVTSMDFSKIEKGLKKTRTAEDQFLSRTAAQAGSMNRAGIKTASNHTELQEHIKAMADLANSNAKLIEVMKHLTPEEIGLKKSGQKIATANTQLGWAKLENQQDRFFKYSNNFMGGLASNLQMMNSRIMNGGGMMGFMGQLGYRMSHNKNGFFSAAEYKGIDKATGKPVYGDLPKNNINRWLGLDKVTGGKGINFGPMAMLAPVAAVAGVVSLGKAIKNLGEEAKAATGEIQMIKTQMSVVMGSDSLAARTYEGIEKYALKSPFGVAQSADMATLLKQSGVNASDLLQTLKMIGDTSSGNAEKMKRVANNYAQIQAIGKASMLDMRQFAYAGIPIYKEVAEYMKVSQVELRKMISEGKVTANVIEAVFKRMTGAGGTFENATMRGAQTLQARMQNLQDAQMIAKSHFGEWYMNFGGSSYNQGFGNFIQNTKENFAEGIGNIFKQWNINDNFKKANSFLDSINHNVIDIRNNNPQSGYSVLYNQLPKEIQDEYIKKNGGIQRAEKDLAAFIKSAGGGRLGLTRVADKEYNSLEHSLFKTRAMYAPGADLPNGIRPGSKEANRFYDSQKNMFNSISDLLTNLDKTMIKESEFKKSFEWYEKNDPRSFLAYSKEEVESARTAEEGKQESLNKKEIANARYFDGTKILKSFDSLAGQFNTLYKQTPYGKWDELNKKEDERAAYNKTYAEFSKYQDSNNKLLMKNIKTLDELNKVLSSGMFKISDTVDVSNMTEEQRKAFIGNMDEVINMSIGQMKADPSRFIGAGASYAKAQAFINQDFMTSAPIQDLLRIKNAAKDAKTLTEAQINTTNAINRYLQFSNHFGENFKGLQLRAMMSSFQSEDYAKSDEPPSLLYRVLGGGLGMNAWRLAKHFKGKSAGDILTYWNDTYGKRELSENLMLGLLGDRKSAGKERSGLSLAEMTAALVTEKGKALNWDKTQKNLEKLAFSANATASSLSAYASAIDAQTNRYKQLYTKLYTQGESLDTVITDKTFDKELASALVNEGVYTKDNKRVTFNADTRKFMAGDKELSQTESVDVGNKLVDVLKRLIDQNDKTANVAESTSDWIEKLKNMKFVANGATSFLRGANPLSGQDIIAHSRLSRISWTEEDYKDPIKRQSFANVLMQRVGAGYDERGFRTFAADKDLSWADRGLKKEMQKLGIGPSTGELTDEQIDRLNRYINKIADAQSAMEKLGEATKNALMGGIGDGINNTMAKLGENIAKGVAGYEDMDKVLKQVGKSMMGNLAAAATQAGLSLISSGKYAAGFALIAAGGLGSFLSGLMTDSKDDKEDDITQKLKDLKADLADLLKQAREDAIYYENHLRHSNALSYNSAVSNTTKVNDAIITPRGNVITTHPEDYLIASKNPSALAGGGSPIVNIDIQNNSGSKLNVKQERRDNGNGGVDIMAVIEEAVGNYISSPRSDDAFIAREIRSKGRSVSA